MGDQAQVLEFGEPAWILTIWTSLTGNAAESYVTSLIATASIAIRPTVVDCECGNCASLPAASFRYDGSDVGRASAIARIESAGGRLTSEDRWESKNFAGDLEFSVHFCLARGVWRPERYERTLARLDAALNRLHMASDVEFERIVSLLERECVKVTS